MRPLKITIAGAGIGGLAAAIALARDGHSVRVSERTRGLGQVGAGIQISPNGMAVLGALGLDEAFRAETVRLEAVRLRDGPSGREVATLDFGLHAGDLCWQLSHRATLVARLANAARSAGAAIELGCDCMPPPAGQALEGEDLLIGADGIRSRMRARVDGASSPFFTRQVAWRTVIPDAGGEPVVEVHMGPGRHLVTYPIEGGRRNIAAFEERTEWVDEGWTHQDDPDNLRAAFAGFGPEVRRLLESVGHAHLWGLFRHRVARRWVQGRKVLLGDAAHPTLPFLAQGANLALEDAWVLAAAIRRHDLPEALERYQALRIPRARRIVDAATSNARNYHLRVPPVRLVAHAALKAASAIAPVAMLKRFDWIYRHDVTSLDV
ncbi:MAG: monooxygenase [Boseongicola sp. SB0662_bin_57]|nr:monooxygenase [Boseongicola sp. SB0662_bin_57]